MSSTGTTIVRSMRLSLGGAAIVTGSAPPRNEATSSGGLTVADRPIRCAGLTRPSPELEAGLASIDGERLAMTLLHKGVPCGPVLDVPDVLNHAHTRHRGMVEERGAYRGTGNPVKLSRTPASLRSVPPAFGSATREALAEVGYSAAEIDALFASGAAMETPRKAATE